MTVLEIVLLLIITVLSICMRRVYGMLVNERMHSDRLSFERQHLREHLYKTVMHLEIFNGGVLYRIHECRETTEAILKHAPEVFRKEPGLVHWLSATDQFLTELDKIVLIDGPLSTDIAKQPELLARRYPPTVYNRVKYGPALHIESN
ncbi:hypothetical protein [Pseudomonas rhodesiae]|jgi:hypothetical protein|uniref:hypothetical protein n=1 Tax=Pseudomonas rhodesiae TaxID=76760 RepID=UPI00209E427A|nr:hypothetical protein [Pseudomonas rhodesiae]MCP1515550.1 hypothetical protein [Pseudomonas rhodesiae]MDF9772953.1 hypothetical protein [Pseudomonas rhodesiae]